MGWWLQNSKDNNYLSHICLQEKVPLASEGLFSPQGRSSLTLPQKHSRSSKASHRSQAPAWHTLGQVCRPQLRTRPQIWLQLFPCAVSWQRSWNLCIKTTKKKEFLGRKKNIWNEFERKKKTFDFRKNNRWVVQLQNKVDRVLDDIVYWWRRRRKGKKKEVIYIFKKFQSGKTNNVQGWGQNEEGRSFPQGFPQEWGMR